MGMTLEEIRILSKGKNQDYKDGWNDATRMCNRSGMWCPSFEGLVFDEKSDDYRAGYFKAYEALEGFIKQTMDENQRLREIQEKHEEEKAYLREKEAQLDVFGQEVGYDRQNRRNALQGRFYPAGVVCGLLRRRRI